jgi:hypothetical protein
MRWPDFCELTAMVPLGGVLSPPSFPCGFRAGGSNGLVAGRFSDVLMPDTKVESQRIPEASGGFFLLFFS